MVNKTIEKIEKFPEKIFFNNEKTMLILILFFALIVRILFLDVESMWIDETISASASQAIIDRGVPQLEGGLIYDRAEIFHYLMALSIMIFKGDLGARLISVIFGVFTVALAYVFAKKFSKDKFAIIGFPLVIALASIEIIYSRQARFYQFFQFFYFLSFYFYYRIVLEKDYFVKNKYLSYFLLLISILITINTHRLAYVLIPLFILGFIIYNFRKKNFTKKNKFKIIFLSLIGIVFITFFAFYVYFENLIYVDSFSKVAYYSFLYYDFLDTNLLIVIISLIGILASLIKNPRENLIILSFVVLPFLGLLFVKFFASRYSYFIFFILFYYFVYALSLVKFRSYILILLIAIHIGVGFSLTPIVNPNYDFTMPTADYRGAHDYISQNVSLENIPLVTTWGPGTNWYYQNNEIELYWIKYSIDGTNSEWATNPQTNREKFSNAIIIDEVLEIPENSIVILDAQAAGKIRPNYHEYFKNNCGNLYSSFNIDVLYCNRN